MKLFFRVWNYFLRVWKSTFWVWKKSNFCKKIFSYPRVWKYRLFFPDVWGSHRVVFFSFNFIHISSGQSQRDIVALFFHSRLSLFLFPTAASAATAASNYLHISSGQSQRDIVVLFFHSRLSLFCPHQPPPPPPPPPPPALTCLLPCV